MKRIILVLCAMLILLCACSGGKAKLGSMEDFIDRFLSKQYKERDIELPDVDEAYQEIFEIGGYSRSQVQNMLTMLNACNQNKLAAVDHYVKICRNLTEEDVETFYSLLCDAAGIVPDAPEDKDDSQNEEKNLQGEPLEENSGNMTSGTNKALLFCGVAVLLLLGIWFVIKSRNSKDTSKNRTELPKQNSMDDDV